MSSHNMHSQSQQVIVDGGKKEIRTSGAPTDAASGYALGCLWTNTATGTQYENKGTATSANWFTINTTETT